MAVTVPKPPLKVPFLDQNGFVSAAWAAWITQVYNRIGGTVALSNEEIANSQDTDVTDLQEQVDDLTDAVMQGRQV